MQPSKTAILIFANSSAVEARRKGIPKSGSLFTALNEDILKKVKKTKLPYVLCTEDAQVGTDFGTRFTSAIASVFARGFERVITVGNDTPHLSTKKLLHVLKNLEQGKTVVGPSTDGGVYVLGFHRDSFEAKSFRALPWQRAVLCDAIIRHFSRWGSPYVLPRLTDIDALRDVRTLLHTVRPLALVLRKLLLALLSQQPPVAEQDARESTRFFQSNLFNKGSPLGVS
ncbi:TIGR04282 family arsenosugar biosynthesis glycosyltransferase [Maribacter sp. 2307ULW6-5]|uniref:TIGR04282 family arsenosugar biosynthesis glycosyltransferase n=1 Tax=Maribacter sp. 2307ULW6-5 TaxID=3386275 RepID=UPI0039BCC648